MKVKLRFSLNQIILSLLKGGGVSEYADNYFNDDAQQLSFEIEVQLVDQRQKSYLSEATTGT